MHLDVETNLSVRTTKYLQVVEHSQLATLLHSLKLRSSEYNRATALQLIFFRFTQITQIYSHFVQVQTHLIAISSFVNPGKNAHREVAPCYDRVR